MDRLERKFDALYGPERYLCSVAAIGAVATVAGAAMSSSSSGKASKAQARAAKEASDAQLQASRESNALQKEIFEQNRADVAPWRNTGESALNELSWRMGLGGGQNAQNALASQTPRDAIYNELLQSGNYKITDPNEAWFKYNYEKNTRTPSNPDFVQGNDYWEEGTDGNTNWWGWSSRPIMGKPPIGVPGGGRAELNAEADRLFAAQQQNRGGVTSNGDPNTRGELMRDFTMADRDADPVYQSGLQFGLDEGRKGYERQGAASGMQLSGATLKALTRYGNDYGSTKAQGAFDRFNQNKTAKYNRLAGISGTGQTAANQIAQLGQNYAGQVGLNNINTANMVGANTIGAGNARASNYIAQGQNWGNALNSLSNLYGQNNMLNQPRAGDSYRGSSNARYL